MKPSLLSGLRVIDLSWGLAGPIAAMLLADNGADVIKVEPPGGDPLRTYPPFRAWNRGKRSVVLDAGDPEFAELCAGADILIENFRPSTAARLGLAPDVLRIRYPRLIHATISGYGLDSPRRDEPGYEALVDAWLGIPHEQQGVRDGPKYNSFPLASYGAAFLVTQGILAALHARHQSGAGQHVETSLVDGAVTLSTMSWHWSEKNCRKFTPGLGKLLIRHLLLLGVLPCGDGKFIQIHSGASGRFAKALEVLGLADKVSPAPPHLEKATPLLPDEAAMLEHEIPRLLKTQPRQHWLKVFEAADVAALPVDPPGAIFRDPQVVHDGMVARLDDAELGPIDVVGPTLKCSEAPPRISGPAPGLGEHDGQSWRPGTPWRDASQKTTPRHPLDGVTIIDFASYFACPYGSKLLADLGAEVVKVEVTTGDPARASDGIFRSAQRGKRCITVDLKSDEGREIARRLIARADVVAHNMRLGAAERLGIDEASVRRINPAAIYLYAPGFGASGPRSHLQSFAPLVSGMCGWLWQAAGKGNVPVQSVSNEDYINGCLTAIWMLMALSHRQRTGDAVRLEGSLLNSTLFAMSEVIMRPDGAPLFQFELDSEQMGLGPLCRLYRTSDGWICLVVALAREWRALRSIAGLETIERDDALAGVLETWFAGRKTADALSLLRAAGVPCEAPQASQTDSYFLDDDNLRRGRVVEFQHARFGRMRDQGHAIRFSDTPGAIRRPSPLFGEHSREILRELGYAEDAILDLKQKRRVHWPEPGDPPR